jgi:hypothetical protein
MTRKTISWAIRVTFANGKEAFLRHGGIIGRGPIATWHSKAKAEREAAFVCEGCSSEDVVTVIERSHGRQDPEAR